MTDASVLQTRRVHPDTNHDNVSDLKRQKIMTLHARCCLFVLGLLLQTVSASAGILISMQNATLTGSGFIDVMVSSTATPGSPDLLDSFSAKLVLAPVGAATVAGLQFSNPQNDSQLGLGNYVFSGNSLTPAPLGNVTSATATNDTYTFGDATVSGSGISLNSSQPAYLLGRIDLSVVAATPGSQYTLTLANDAFTDFSDPSFGPLTIDPASFNSATITIGTLTAAVPEPGHWLALFGLSSLLVGLHRRRRMTTAMEASVPKTVSTI